MKKSVIAVAALFVVANSTYAADISDILSMNTAGLEKAGFSVSINGGGHPAPKPGIPQPAQQHHQGGNQNNYPGNGHHPQPVPTPHHPQNPPVNPGYTQAQMHNFRFDSSAFPFMSDASASMESAAADLQRAGFLVLEKRPNYTSYSLVFMAPSYMSIGRYTSGTYQFQSDAQRAAEECKRAMSAQGKIILEKNVNGTQFTISYLSSGSQMMTQTYTAGTYSFQSDAAQAMNATAEALKSMRGVVVLEKIQNFTTYTVKFLAPFRLEPQKYVSGTYNFQSDAQRAAGETAAAFASQGMIVLEKNVNWTQFTITYVSPRYY